MLGSSATTMMTPLVPMMEAFMKGSPQTEAHVLHAGHGSLATVGHADGGLEGGLLVGAPVGDNTLLFGLFALHHVFGNLGRRGARIAVDSATAGIDKCLSYSLVA